MKWVRKNNLDAYTYPQTIRMYADARGWTQEDFKEFDIFQF
jgi:hypothetical protein